MQGAQCQNCVLAVFEDILSQVLAHRNFQPPAKDKPRRSAEQPREAGDRLLGAQQQPQPQQ